MRFSSSLGVAVVGTGFIGPVHVEAIRRLGHRVVGVVASTPEKAEWAARAWQIERGYPDLASCLADPAVSVVHLASPNHLHYEQALAVLAAGKHLVCEKPLAMTVPQGEAIVAAARRRPELVAAVNYNIRFYPLVLELRARYRRGDYGRLFHVVGSYFQDWLLEANDYNWRVEAEAGGPLRAVADIGTHWLDTIQFLIGEPIVAVCAVRQTVHPVRQKPRGGRATFQAEAATATEAVTIHTEDTGLILFRFASGALGSLAVSQVVAGFKNSLRFEIACANASLSWGSEQPNEAIVGRRDHLERLQRDPGQLVASVQPYSNYPAGHAEGFPDTFKQLYRAVYADVLSGGSSPEPLYATLADGVRELQLCEAILLSMQQNRWVELG